MSRLKIMDNKKKLDWNSSNTQTVRESIILNEKIIREQENIIQSIVFTRIYERRMNIKVWKYFIIDKILIKKIITFHSIKESFINLNNDLTNNFT